jgi:hypothetical protein
MLVRFEVVTVVSRKIVILLDVLSHGMVDRYLYNISEEHGTCIFKA